MSTNYKIAIVGASGLVGRTVLKVLEEKMFPHVSYTLFASSKSAGSKIRFLGQDYTICELNEKSFDIHFNYAIFCGRSEVFLRNMHQLLFPKDALLLIIAVFFE